MKNCKQFALIALAALLIFACKKHGEEASPVTETLKAGVHVTRLVCFPYDSVSLTFIMQTEKGIPPYSYQWNSPPDFTGEGPFTMHLRNDTTLDVEVSDSVHHSQRYVCTIKKDTIDSLTWDYRNGYTGSYACEVFYRGVRIDTAGVWHHYDTTYQDTLSVSKHTLFNMLNITTMPELTYYPKYKDFRGYHTTAAFSNDSIDLYFFLTPVGLFNWTFKGKKL
jgi:hypothetical protein